MNVREALRKRRWFTYLRTGTDRESAVADFEKGLRAAYWEGARDAQNLEEHRGAPGVKIDDKRGVTAGVAAMVDHE